MAKWILRESFDQYRNKVDRIIQTRTGLSLDDLPDVMIRDWYDDHVSPAQAALRAIRNAKEG